jgi:3-oxoacyl-(acyl-carrier-protein) synthase III
LIPVRILGTASVLSGRPRTTTELAESLVPRRNPAAMERKTGIRTRYWVDEGTTMAGLGAEALGQALAASGLEARALRRIIFATSTGGDCLIPATANRVAAALGLAGSCDCLDVNNACMGFLTAFDLGARSVATGLGPVGVVVVETPSRYVTPADHRPYLVFADAAAAAVLGTGRPGEGVLAARLWNNGSLPPDTVLAHPGLTGQREFVTFVQPADDIVRIALDALCAGAKATLEEAGLRLDEVEWVLPHQPSGAMLAYIVSALGLDPARIVRVVEEIGSVGSASVPVSLDRLLRTRPVRPGDRILMVGVGAGVAHGAILYRVGT